MTDEEFDKDINERLDGKWNMPYGYKMSIRFGYVKGAEKKVRRRLSLIASKRNLDLKIERLSKNMPDVLAVTFEAREPSQIK